MNTVRGDILLKNKAQEEAHLTRFLLGNISDGERERLEEGFFEDDEAFEEMLIAEDELTDAYVHGDLSTEERTQFEKLFLSSPQGQERVQFSRSLADAIANARPVETAREIPHTARPTLFAALRARGAALPFALAAGLFITIGFPWFLFERARMREDLQQTRAENAVLSQKAQELERRVAAEQARSAEVLAQLEGKREPSTQGNSQGGAADARENPPQNGREPASGAGKTDAVVAQQSPDRRRVRDGAGTNAGATDTARGSTIKNPRTPQLPIPARTVSANTAGSPFKIPKVKETPPTSLAVFFALTPGQVRGGGANTIIVPGSATSITFQLNLEGNADASYENYRAVIETADGKQVRRMELGKPLLPPGTLHIELPPVPASDLPPGDYILLLSGQRPNGSFEGVADYSFRVVRK